MADHDRAAGAALRDCSGRNGTLNGRNARAFMTLADFVRDATSQIGNALAIMYPESEKGGRGHGIGRAFAPSRAARMGRRRGAGGWPPTSPQRRCRVSLETHRPELTISAQHQLTGRLYGWDGPDFYERQCT